MQAKDIMSSPVVTVTPDASVAEVAALLLEKKISGVPVVDQTGQVVGILSEGDLLRRVDTARTGWKCCWARAATPAASSSPTPAASAT
jgi:CBS domain-containing protein